MRLQVSQLDRSLRFYQDIVGLAVIERGGGRAMLGTEGAARPLVSLQERPGAVPVPPYGRLGLYHYAILLPDRAALGRFLSHAVAHSVRLATADHAVSEAVYLSDPDGLGLEVYADRPRASWRRRGEELFMTTEPLAVSDVMAAAGGSRWSGMPGGTVMGHVHLHVGALRAAAALYEDALGLERTVWSYPGALFLAAGGYHHHLGTNVWAAGARPAGDDDARLLEWEVVVPAGSDADAVASRCAARGYEVRGAPADWCITDPWGTVVRVRS